MKKTTFKVSKSWLNIVLNLFIGILISLFTIILSFFILEKYFTNYYLDAKNTPQIATNLPIYINSKYRSWGHKPNSYVKHGYGEPIPEISINSIGLRDDEIPELKTKKRYLLLGDSFTFGMGVDQKLTFARWLQYFLGKKKYLVINAGVIGQTIDDAFLYLKNDGIKLKPDIVIYNFFVGNDITELKRHKWETDNEGNITKVIDKILYADEKNRLRHRESNIPKSYFIFWLKERIAIFKQKYYPATNAIDSTLTWPVFLPLTHKLQDPNLNDYWIQFEEILKQMSEYCKKNNIKFIISVIPMDVQVSKKYWNKYPNLPFDDEAFKMQRPQKQIKLLADKYDLNLIDMLPLFQEAEPIYGNFYFSNDPHFNVLGHRFYGAFLYNYLINNLD